MRVARLRPLEGEPIDRGLVEEPREELGAEWESSDVTFSDSED